MYKQVLDPVGDSLFLSSLVAMIPIVTLFVLLGGLRLAAHVASLVALVLAILIAIVVYGMPVGQTLDEFIQQQERGYIEATLAHSAGSREKAASMLGISMATLYRKVEPKSKK